VTKQKLPQSAQIAITVAAFVVIAILGYFVAVKPQKSKASRRTVKSATRARCWRKPRMRRRFVWPISSG